MNGVQDPFSRLVVALEPWLDQLVIIGGWAHQLYRRHPAAQELDYPPLATLDTDVAVPLKLAAREEDIRSRCWPTVLRKSFWVMTGPRRHTTTWAMKPLVSTWSSSHP